MIGQDSRGQWRNLCCCIGAGEFGVILKDAAVEWMFAHRGDWTLCAVCPVEGHSSVISTRSLCCPVCVGRAASLRHRACLRAFAHRWWWNSKILSLAARLLSFANSFLNERIMLLIRFGNKCGIQCDDSDLALYADLSAAFKLHQQLEWHCGVTVWPPRHLCVWLS